MYYLKECNFIRNRDLNINKDKIDQFNCIKQMGPIPEINHTASGVCVCVWGGTSTSKMYIHTHPCRFSSNFA